ncbi:MAG: BspA family leucine-rich repeat surface protein [Prevotella sp.]|nr:BspA family leucine-rich repeat surface protein [Prevotella sp.]
MKKILLTILCVLLSTMSWAQGTTTGDESYNEAYGVLVIDENNTASLTMYYDANRDAHREGQVIGLDEMMQNQAWMMYRENVTTVVFDSSFAECRPTSTAFWFAYCRSLTSIVGLQYLRTDETTNMSFMFNECSSLTSLDLSSLNTENVTNISGMLGSCRSLTSVDLSGFNTRQVTNMNSLFEQSAALTTINLSSFNTSQVTDMSYMFNECSALTTIYVGSDWSTEAVTNGTDMFNKCTNLVGGAGTTFSADHIDHTYAHIDGGTDNPGYFTDKNANNPVPYAVLSDNNTVLTFYYDDQKDARGGMSVEPTSDEYGYYYSWWSNRETITAVIFDASFANYTSLTITANWFDGMGALTTIEGISNLKTDNVTNMGGMFLGCSGLTSLDLRSFNTSNVTNMGSMFDGCSSLTSLDVSGFNTASVKEMSRMFNSCSSLTTLDVTNFNTANVTSMFYMFKFCSGLTTLDLSNFNTANVTAMFEMFASCSELKTIFAGYEWATNSETDGGLMFYDCPNLVGGAGTVYSADHTDHTYAHIDGGTANPGYFTDKNASPSDEIIQFADAEVQRICVENWDTNGDGALSMSEAAAVTEISNTLFQKNESITSFNELQYFTGLTSIQYSTFERCVNLTSVVIPKNVRTVGNDAFYGCKSLTSILVPDQVEYVGANTWEGCTNVTSVYIGSGLRGVNVNPFSELENVEAFEVSADNRYFASIDGILMSKDGKTLVSYPAGKRNEEFVIADTITTVGSNAFRGCVYLKRLTITQDSQVSTDEQNNYWYINSLEELTLNEGVAGIGFYAFTRCGELKIIHFPKTLGYIGKETFVGCNSISTIYSDVETPFTFEDNVFSQSVYQNAQLIVPAGTVSAYRTTSGWSNFLNITDGSTPTEKVATPTFSWRNDELTMSCSTEGATIMYQMSDEDTDGDGVITDSDYKQYSAPIEVKRDVIIKAIGIKEGMTTSDTITLDYPYEAWYKLYETCMIGQEILSRASRSSRVPQEMVDQGEAYIAYALDMYAKRTEDKERVENTTADIAVFLSEIEQMMRVPATYSNYVLTAEEDATMAEIADQYGSYYGNQVAAIVWNSSVPMTESDLQRFTSNPNLLIYAQSESMVPANRDNVVINGVAKNVVLTDTVSGNCNFYAPQEFTAEAIQYTRTFSQQTQIGVSRGWEAIALPFTVQTYTHADRGVIAPFGNSASENHFWLRELTQNGLQNAQTIEANKPYIISMPNSEEYRPETNLAGQVTFSALNAIVPVTEATPVEYGSISLVPAFQSRSAQTEIYALNVGEERNGYPEGSVFERDYRTVRPFEAYTLHRDNQNPAPQFIMIGGDMGNGTTGIEELVDKRMNTNDSWYTIDGRRLQGAPAGKGLYIRNGKKVIVR